MYWIYQLCKNVDDRQRRGVLCSMKTTLILDWFWMYPDNYPHPPHIMITVSVAQLGWAVNRRLVTTPVTARTQLPLVSLTPLHWAEAGQTQHIQIISPAFVPNWQLKYWLRFPIHLTAPGSMILHAVTMTLQSSERYFLARCRYCGSDQDTNNRHSI